MSCDAKNFFIAVKGRNFQGILWNYFVVSSNDFIFFGLSFFQIVKYFNFLALNEKSLYGSLFSSLHLFK